MLDDELGMHADDVKKYGDILDTKLSKEKKLYDAFMQLNSKAKPLYKSNNSKNLEEKNTNIESQIEIKIANLKSYKNYIDKTRNAYIQTTLRVINMTEEDRRQLK